MLIAVAFGMMKPRLATIRNSPGNSAGSPQPHKAAANAITPPVRPPQIPPASSRDGENRPTATRLRLPASTMPTELTAKTAENSWALSP